MSEQTKAVLNSGGPIMLVECVEGENAICSWFDDEDGVRRRKGFPVACLSWLVTFEAMQQLNEV